MKEEHNYFTIVTGEKLEYMVADEEKRSDVRNNIAMTTCKMSY